MLTMLSLLAAVALAPQGTLADASVPVALASEQRTDPADSLYREGRRLLNRGRYVEAAAAFGEIIRRYPRSALVPDAYYWSAFALYRTDDDGNLRRAATLLETQQSRYGDAETEGDGEALLARVYGELARRGDPRAAEWVQSRASAAAPAPDPEERQRADCSDEDDDPRMAALNALMQMSPASAAPILRRVLERRDACSEALRRQAVFVLSQLHTSETEEVILSVARSDPSADVRRQAVFWLSQAGGDRAVAALDSIARGSSDAELREQAIFALSQIHGPRARQILRDYAARADAPEESRERAIFWLGQSHGADDAQFLRDLFARVSSENLKEKIIFSLSQGRSAANTRWLLDLATDRDQGIEIRKKAIFWAGQSGAGLADLIQLYDRTAEREIREQLIFVYSQRHDAAAVDRLIEIARNERDRELRNRAIFWLGQSRDPRAARALLEIIGR